MAQSISNTVGDNSFQQGVAKIGGLIGLPDFSGATNAASQAQSAQNALTNRLSQGNVQPALANQTIGSVFNSASSPKTTSGFIPPMNSSTPTQGYISPTTPLSGTNTYGLSTSSPNWYQLQPGETTSNYYARTQGQTQAQALSGSTSNITPGILPPPQTPQSSAPQGGVDPNANPYTAQAPTFPGLVGTLSTTAATSSPQFQAAENQYLSANQQLEQLKTQAAQQNANIGGSRTNLAEAGGEQGLLQNLTANSESALTGEMSAAQAAAQAATGQQATQQSGLAGAAGLSAPQGANALGTFNPTTGQYSSYGGGVGGGAAAAGGVESQIQQGGQIQTMTGQQSQAQALAQNLSSLIESAGINPNNASVFTGFMNGVNQWLNNQSGDPRYQNFANLLNEISSRYASILNQSGGTPTDQSTISHSIINGMASGQSIQQVLGSLDKNATDSINALKGAAGNNAISGNSNNSISAGGYNYIKNAQGQWVVSQ